MNVQTRYSYGTLPIKEFNHDVCESMRNAHECARSQNHRHINTAHVLHGLCVQVEGGKDNRMKTLFKRLSLSSERVYSWVERSMPREPVPTPEDPEMTDACSDVITSARVRGRYSKTRVNVADLLVCLAEKDRTLSSIILRAMIITLHDIRREMEG